MSKLTKKERKQLKKQKFQQGQVKPQVKTRTPNMRKITLYNWKFLLFVITICILVYYNSIDNQLTLVDDMQGIVFNESIRDLGGVLRGHNIQKIFYAISYKLFEFNPLPIRIASVFLHIVTTILVFYFVYLIWGKKIARIATLVFAVHPINTEAVTWISGAPYLYYAVFTFIIFNLYLLYYAKNQKKFLYAALAAFIVEMLIMQSPWVLVPPIGLIVLDQLILEKKYDLSRLWWVALFAIPISIYLITYFGSAYESRLAARSAGGTRITMHTQALKPVIEGYPYTTYLMSKLYVFPKNLTVYYDGMEVTTGLYVIMYLVFVIYAALTLYLLKKQRQIAGILIMLAVLIAPAYSPIKITWFLSERYLYSGTALVGVLFAMGTIQLQRKYKSKYIAYGILGLVLIIFSIRTILRNNDWQDTETLSYANMKTAPLSVRAYNDLGGHYYYKGEIMKAVEWYEKGLHVVPTSGTAINNLGFIYFELGPLIFWEGLDWPEKDEAKAAELFQYGMSVLEEGGEPRTISYFFNKSLVFNPDNVDVTLFTADLYMSLGMPNHAEDLYLHALNTDPQNEFALKALDALYK